jgi:PPOX class probable F420-dependent enzyme
MLSTAEGSFVEQRPVAHLATADATGHPHVIPVCFAYLDGCFYIAIDEKPKRSLRLKRLRNIEQNPQVALVFDHYDDDWTRLGWVLIHGSAAVIDGGVEHTRAIERLREGYPQYRAMALESRPVIRVTAERVSSWGRLR